MIIDVYACRPKPEFAHPKRLHIETFHRHSDSFRTRGYIDGRHLVSAPVVSWTVLFCVIVLLSAEIISGEISHSASGSQTGSGSHLCPTMCACADVSGESGSLRMRCDDRNLTEIPSIMLTVKVLLLNLSSNRIERIPNASFANLVFLQSLHLGSNRISQIGLGTFRGLYNLTELYLQNNFLSHVNSSTFMDLTILRVLDLSQNQIYTIPKDVFRDTPQLQRVYLQWNYISEIQPLILSHLKYLTILDLSHNPISKLDAELFTHLDNLKKLNLGDTNLAHLDPKVFQDFLHHSPPSMVSVIVGSNPGGTPQEGKTTPALSYTSSLPPRLTTKSLNLTGIPVVCDCQVVEFVSWALDNSLDINQHDPHQDDDKLRFRVYLPNCQSPPHVAGMSLVEFYLHNGSCQGMSQVEALTSNHPSNETAELAMHQSGHLPYDSMLGWYTAATLGGMLFLFLLCVGIEKLKICYTIHQQKKRRLKQLMAEGLLVNSEDSNRPLREEILTTVVICENETVTVKTEDRTRLGPHRQSIVRIETFRRDSLAVSPQTSFDGATPKRENSPPGGAAGRLPQQPTSRDNMTLPLEGAVASSSSSSSAALMEKNTDSSSVKDSDEKSSMDSLTFANDIALLERLGKDTRNMVVDLHPDCPLHNADAAWRLKQLMKTKKKGLNSLLLEDAIL